jgi:hypothetical protein
MLVHLLFSFTSFNFSLLLFKSHPFPETLRKHLNFSFSLPSSIYPLFHVLLSRVLFRTTITNLALSHHFLHFGRTGFWAQGLMLARQRPLATWTTPSALVVLVLGSQFISSLTPWARSIVFLGIVVLRLCIGWFYCLVVVFLFKAVVPLNCQVIFAYEFRFFWGYQIHSLVTEKSES